MFLHVHSEDSDQTGLLCWAHTSFCYTPSVRSIYRGYIVFVFSVTMFVIPPVYKAYSGYIVFVFFITMFAIPPVYKAYSGYQSVPAYSSFYFFILLSLQFSNITIFRHNFSRNCEA